MSDPTDDILARLHWMADNRPDDQYAETLRTAAGELESLRAALASRDATLAAQQATNRARVAAEVIDWIEDTYSGYGVSAVWATAARNHFTPKPEGTHHD